MSLIHNVNLFTREGLILIILVHAEDRSSSPGLDLLKSFKEVVTWLDSRCKYDGYDLKNGRPLSG